jgi:hypothetical protein
LQEPETKFERLQKSMNAAKERARKTSATILGGSASASAAALRRESRMMSEGVSNLGYAQGPHSSVIVIGGSGGDGDGNNNNSNSASTELERSIRARLQKREGIMR